MATTTKKRTPAQSKKASSTAQATTKKTTTRKVAATASKVETKQVKEQPRKPKTANKLDRLNIWNLAMAVLHTVQGVAVIVLSKSDSLFPVTTSYLTLDPIASSDTAPSLVPATRHLFDVNLAYLVAAFFFMSAIAHLFIATVYRKRYEANLQKGINKVRWYEYGISASTMMIAISSLVGVSDISTIVLIFGATLVMNLLGLVMEIYNQTTQKTSWISYVVGTISGLLPWVAVGTYLWGANVYGDGEIPTFVYYIYASIFVCFSSFAVNMYLQYKGKGRWSDYLFGEKSYMVLSLVAKSALAWQVFAGTLRP